MKPSSHARKAEKAEAEIYYIKDIEGSKIFEVVFVEAIWAEQLGGLALGGKLTRSALAIRGTYVNHDHVL